MNKLILPMFTCLQNLKKVSNITVGFVGGSDLNKQKEQLGEENFFFEWRFSENGLLAVHNNLEIHNYSILFCSSIAEMNMI
jgi:phosphomannomutase